MSSNDELDVGTFCPNQYKPCVFLAHHLGYMRNNTNLLVGVYSKHRQLACKVGDFARLDINTRPRMANRNLSWVLGAHMHFRDLDFIITVEGELAMAPAAIQPLPFVGLDAIAEAFEELRLHALGAHAPESN